MSDNKKNPPLTMKLLDERLKALEKENTELKARLDRMQKTDEAVIAAMQQMATSFENTNEAIGTLLHNYAKGLVPASEYARICQMLGIKNN